MICQANNCPEGIITVIQEKMSKKIRVSEIVQHRKPDDVWIVVNGKVYDMTNFAPLHPGGSEGQAGFGCVLIVLELIFCCSHLSLRWARCVERIQ